MFAFKKHINYCSTYSILRSGIRDGEEGESWRRMEGSDVCGTCAEYCSSSASISSFSSSTTFLNRTDLRLVGESILAKGSFAMVVDVLKEISTRLTAVLPLE